MLAAQCCSSADYCNSQAAGSIAVLAGTSRTVLAVRHGSQAIGRGMILDGTNRRKEPAVVCATVLLRQRYALLWEERAGTADCSRCLQVKALGVLRCAWLPPVAVALVHHLLQVYGRVLTVLGRIVVVSQCRDFFLPTPLDWTGVDMHYHPGSIDAQWPYWAVQAIHLAIEVW